MEDEAKDTTADLAFLHEQRAAELLSIFYEVRKRLHHDGGFKELALDFPIKELVEVMRRIRTEQKNKLQNHFRTLSWVSRTLMILSGPRLLKDTKSHPHTTSRG